MNTTNAKFATDAESIKEFVRYLLFRKDTRGTHYNRDELQIELIKKTKCTFSDADDFLYEMDELGLELCRETVGGYDLQKFALMRDIITEDDVKKIKETMDEAEDELLKKEMEDDPGMKKYIEGLIYVYGSNKNNWNYEEYNEMNSRFGDDLRSWPKDR